MTADATGLDAKYKKLVNLRILDKFTQNQSSQRINHFMYHYTMSSNRNWNTGNFAFPPHDQAQKKASKGGQQSNQQSSQGIFANMDPSKQVCYYFPVFNTERANSIQRNNAPKGGLSGGGFTASSQTAQDSQRRGSRQAYMFDESEMPDE